ncbi:ABC transporter nucleotide binding/ATPase protein [Tanticharoenia sakaeratensis NBRC 103193]|uniref:ABC transporter nucleotide binding/ATPase protein n=2 Tax=Tanticharoenia TaxID=444052 RepID=A0A0D6MHZ2_9PROT|nr:ABC transporter nucleotide binding/ATPase protein [Tanticharoenia sakaeratensis NBRC 103193]GBQ20580.1 ribose ABC transporter ATP-binding protein [Tanticharoenia sakaeratensis NBRC 103193]
MEHLGMPRLRLEGLTKRYAGITVLDDVGFDVQPGEVHALLGENGAGKSTLLKILSGVVKPEHGTIAVDGVPLKAHSMAAARSAGIAMIHQELQQVPELSVAQNMFLGHPMLKSGVLLDRKEMERRAAIVLKDLDPTIDVKARVKDLKVASRQLVEIARALLFDAKIIAMDEPTSSLMPSEFERLAGIILDLQQRGVAIIYVSHKLDEVLRICSRGTVLRDGKFVAAVTLAETTERKLVSMMVGRDIVLQDHHSSALSDVVLRAHRLSWSDKVKDVSFELHRGEVLGVAGLVGAGRTELMQLLSGLHQPSSGEIYVHGTLRKFGKSRDAIQCGIGLVPEERKRDGIVPLRSAFANAALTSWPRFARFGWRSEGRVRAKVDHLFDELQLRPRSPDKPIGLFSGGNQQKIILARWLLAETEILLLDEPTRGIDVGAKQEIYRLVHDLAAQGRSIIVVSSELLEIMALSDRVLVMREGRLAAELGRDELTEDTIMQHAAVTAAPETMESASWAMH